MLSKEGDAAFDLVLQIAWNFWVSVSKLLEVVFHVEKGAKFGVQKVNNGQDICSRASSFGNGKLWVNICDVLIKQQQQLTFR